MEFNDGFQVLAVSVAVLSLLLPRGRQDGYSPLQPKMLPLALSVLVRWMIILAVLLAVGYVTKYSEDFSRRVMLTWVFCTPALLVIVALYLHDVMRRLLNDAAVVRRVVFVGCNEASMALARMHHSQLTLARHDSAGFFDDRAADRLGACGSMRRLGAMNDIFVGPSSAISSTPSLWPCRCGRFSA